MIYINSQGDYPRHIGDIQLDSPGFKEGDELPTGWVQVTESERPVAGVDEVTVEDFPTEVDGVMTQAWIVRALTAEEKERRDAPKRAREKLIDLGLTEEEVNALVRGLR